MPKKTPTKKTSPRRYAGGSHAKCAEKRTALKERIRLLTTDVDMITTKYELLELQLDIYRDVLQTVIETMGLEIVLDPFGSGLPDSVLATGDKALKGPPT